MILIKKIGITSLAKFLAFVKTKNLKIEHKVKSEFESLPAGIKGR